MASCMMNGYKVLDLTDKKGFLVGKLLADLGMEVIKVEKPGGDPDRMQPPYYKGEAKAENSLFFEAYNMNKKSVTLDIEKEDGKKLFLDMVKKVDFVIESFDPGYLDSIGLGYEDISAVKPEIIMASLTPFGQKGPDAKLHIDDDLVLQSLSTMLKRSGDPDRAPLKISDYPQSWLTACMDVIEACMVANYYRTQTGEGQYIDCAIIESIIGDPVSINDYNELGKEGVRSGSVYSGAGLTTPMIWHCKDGFIAFQLRGGKMGQTNQTGLTKWMIDEGVCPDFIRDFDWEHFEWRTTTQETLDKLEEGISPFLLSHTKKELIQEGIKRNVMMGMVANVPDLIDDVQFNARNFWASFDYDGKTAVCPGAFAKFSETPIEGFTRAPHPGENNAEVYADLCGLKASDVEALKAKGIV